MSSLSDKLKSLGVQIGTDDIEPQKDKHHAPELIDILPGAWHETPHGETFVVQKRYPAGHAIGGSPLQPYNAPDALAHWNDDPDLLDLKSDEIAYIDTETTGLSGGTGTYTFLIGVGKFCGDQFEFRQFFMQDPAQEPAQLSALESYLASVKALVSYNGKAFDLPRLQTRYKTHHWPPPLQDLSHIDLLHLARRLWKNHLPSCTLGDIEYHILGIERSDQDVPGWQVAELFFEYLHSQNPSPLKRIFYHNEIDVLSMVALLNRIADLLKNPTPENVHHPSELYSLGNVYADIGNTQRAISILERTLDMSPENLDVYHHALKSLSFLYKKIDDYPSAIPLWAEAANRGGTYGAIELAKYYEHQKKSLQEALHWTLTAISLVNMAKLEADRESDLLPELHHRLERLKRKLS